MRRRPRRRAALISRFALDVLGELVERELDRRDPPVAAFELLVEADPSANRRQGLLLDAVALQDAATQAVATAAVNGGIIASTSESVARRRRSFRARPSGRVRRRQKEDALEGHLRSDLDRERRQLDRPDPRAWRQVVGSSSPRVGVTVTDGATAWSASRSSSVSATAARAVFVQAKPPHRTGRLFGVSARLRASGCSEAELARG